MKRSLLIIVLILMRTSAFSSLPVNSGTINHRILESNTLLASGTIEMNYLSMDSVDVYRTRISIDPLFLGKTEIEMLSFVDPSTKLAREAFYVSRNRDFNDVSNHDSVFIRKYFHSDFSINTLDHFIFNQEDCYVVDVEKDTLWAENNLSIFDFQSALLNVNKTGIESFNIAHIGILCSVPVKKRNNSYEIQFKKYCGAASRKEGLSIKSAEIEYDTGLFPKRIKLSKNWILSVEYLDKSTN